MPNRFTKTDLDDLKRAKDLLENPAFIARLTDLIGGPVEGVVERLPAPWKKHMLAISRKALSVGLDYAIRSLGRNDSGASRHGLHRVLVSISGALGGFFGLAALTVELPLSTCIMLRSIADVARSEGHDLSRPEVRLACLEVLALGGKSQGDDASEQGYWVMRAYLAKTFSDAVTYIGKKGLMREGGPLVARFVARIASRFSQYVTEEVAVKSLPVVGAVLGAGVNLLFIEHFQNMARGHFIVKRLEDKYGPEVVEKKYKSLPTTAPPPRTHARHHKEPEGPASPGPGLTAPVD